jgi:hypothetical protein
VRVASYIEELTRARSAAAALAIGLDPLPFLTLGRVDASSMSATAGGPTVIEVPRERPSKAAQ